MADKLPLLSAAEIGRHSRPDDLWLVVDHVVYDLTAFAAHHPGGAAVLERCAGRDATKLYQSVHAPSLITAAAADSTDASTRAVGRLDELATAALEKSDEQATTPITSPQNHTHSIPPLHTILSLHDMATAAAPRLPAHSAAYIATGTEDNITRDANGALLRRIWLRPTVLRDVSSTPERPVRLQTSLFGGHVPLSMPVYASPTGTSRTGGPDGELAIVRGAAAAGIVAMISTVASFPHEEIVAALPDDDANSQAIFQVYVDRDRRRTEALIRKVLRVAWVPARGARPARSKIKAIVVTADLPVSSKREADERANPAQAGKAGIARQASSFLDASFSWEDLLWLRHTVDAAASAAMTPATNDHPPLPILVKGIQCAADARRALDWGCQGIIIGNHGGRAADTAPPAILTLLECHRCCPEIFGRLEVLVDGGFRRGSDVLKAVCLGASAVGVGRPFVYALAYGQAGVEHVAAVLRDELQTTMQLCGLRDLMRDASPDYVNTGGIDHMVPGLHHPYAIKRLWPAKL